MMLTYSSERQSESAEKQYSKIASSETNLLRAIDSMRPDLKAPLQRLVELSQGREGNDQDLNFACGLESFTHAHTGEFQQLSKSASRAIDRGHICLLLLKSLHFTQIRDRKLQIGARSAYPNIFAWIFEKNSRGEHQGQNFAEWLQAEESSSSIFWVASRPGTGKSTLMHFLPLALETKDFNLGRRTSLSFKLHLSSGLRGLLYRNRCPGY
jgi:hypothetical protein